MGSHYGVGKTDQPKEFAYVSDFDFFENKMARRFGAIKNDAGGKTGSIKSIFNIRIGGANLIGLVSNGVMDAQDIDTDYSVDPVFSDWTGYYRFLTDASDYSGNSYDGTPTDVSFASNIATFNGSSSEISLPDDIAVWRGSTTYTMSFWVRPTLGSSMTIVYDWPGFPQNSLQLSINNIGSIRFLVSIGGFDFTAFDVEGALTTLTWTHVCFVKSGSQTLVYIDGALYQTSSSDTAFNGNGATLNVGSTGSGSWLTGDLSNMMMWNRSLTAEEVLFVYNNYPNN